MDVPARSTSENTAPNPLTPAGVVPPVPGMEKTPLVILLPIGANRRFALKGAKSVAYWRLIRSRLSAPPVAAAWVRPVPGVVNVAPRVFWNTVNGVTGAVPSMTGGPPPSQLISRRPLESGPGLLPLFGLPRAPLKASTVSVIDATLAPLSEKMEAAGAGAAHATHARAVTSRRGPGCPDVIGESSFFRRVKPWRASQYPREAMNRALAAGAGRVSAAVNVSKQEPIERRGNESFMFASPEKPAPGLDAAEAS